MGFRSGNRLTGAKASRTIAAVSGSSHQIPPLALGALFLFVNRRRKSAKVLLWDGTGLCVYSKRLSKGRFACLWGAGPGEPVQLTQPELALFLEGAELTEKLPLSPPEFLF